MATNNPPQPQAPGAHDAPSPELIDKFLDLQQKELEVRTQQLALDSQHEENNKLIAQESIKAQVNDRENERGHIERRIRLVFIGSTILVIVLLIFCGFALSIGKEAVVYKFAEIAGLFSAGFIGGYGAKAAKTSRSEQKSAKTPSK